VRKYKSFSAQFKAVADAPEGVFEAIVAVFNNVDRGGDKIIPGAFKDSLAEWDAKARPIPVIFSHQWENLDAHIGHVLEAKEVEDGLYVKAQLDMDEEFARRVWKKMRAGTLAEFSFAYDVVEGAWVDVQTEGKRQAYYELRKLDLLEVGPCLVGMNPETELLGVKNKTIDPALAEYVDNAVEAALAKRLGGKQAGNEGPPEGEARKTGKPSGQVGPSVLAAQVAVELIEAGIDE